MKVVLWAQKKTKGETNVSMNIDLLSMKLYTSMTFPSECYVKFLHEYAVVCTSLIVGSRGRAQDPGSSFERIFNKNQLGFINWLSLYHSGCEPNF